MYYKVAPEQNLTYFMSIGPKNPLLVSNNLSDYDPTNCTAIRRRSSPRNQCSNDIKMKFLRFFFLQIEGYLFNGDNVYYSNDADSLLNLCDNYQNGTWEYLITEIVKNGIIPNGTCSVDKVNHHPL